MILRDSKGNILGETTGNDTYPLKMPINIETAYAFLPDYLGSTPLIITGSYIIIFLIGTKTPQIFFIVRIFYLKSNANSELYIGEHTSDYIQFTLESLS